MSKPGDTIPSANEVARIREVLTHNGGFDPIEEWTSYAINHNFSKVVSQKLTHCPDCGNQREDALVVAQYVYYSTLIHLIECFRCGLTWADRHIDPAIISAHFERGYKGREYFIESRALIFSQLASVVAELAPHGGSVLDVGGAQGDLLHAIKLARPDLDLTLCDLSDAAVAYAQESFGIRGIKAGIAELRQHATQYDVVILSDVLYYEPSLREAWGAINNITKPSGAVVLRIPNKEWAIRLTQRLRKVLARERRQTNVRFFNPEHIYLLSRAYLDRRLAMLGFSDRRWLPSAPLRPAGRSARLAARIAYALSSLASVLTGTRLIATPSMVVIARK